MDICQLTGALTAGRMGTGCTGCCAAASSVLTGSGWGCAPCQAAGAPTQVQGEASLLLFIRWLLCSEEEPFIFTEREGEEEGGSESEIREQGRGEVT